MNAYRRGDYAVNVITGATCMVLERHGPSMSPFYMDYAVQYKNKGYGILRLRHMRRAMHGEARRFPSQAQPTPSKQEKM